MEAQDPPVLTPEMREYAMKLARRDFLRLSVGAAALLPVLPVTAFAANYPIKPVRIVVGFAPGSASDILTRLIGQKLSERLKQPFVTENRPGAGATLAAEEVVRASADGYTLLSCSSADAVSASAYPKLRYDFIGDVAPVAGIADGPLVLVVDPSLPLKSVPDFIAYAKANPGKVNFGSAGVGTMAQMAGELFKSKAGVDLVHVPYRGLAPALTDLISGRLQAVFSTMPPAIAYVNSGKLRALAVTSKSRHKALPDLPAIAEFLPGYQATLMVGVGAPKKTPVETIAELNKEINAILADPEVEARLAQLGNVPLPMSSTDFGKLLASETEKWAKVVRDANIKMN
jgi:tripartite-type tricarboxylate transporter receptor subunit TctC